MTLSGVLSAVNVDIGTSITSFDGANDTLTNTGGLTSWTAGWTPGTIFSGQDFTTLGVSEISFAHAAGTWGATDDFSYAVFDGITISTGMSNNYFTNDNFSEASFIGSTFDLYGNQPFLQVDLTNANFTGAIINYNSYLASTGKQNVNLFRDADLDGADFTNTTFNLDITGTDVNILEGFFGSGDINLSGAVFNFSGNAAHIDAAAAHILSTLTSTDTYDQDFYDNNFETFGFTDASSFAAAVPEPSSLVLITMGSLLVVAQRKKK